MTILEKEILDSEVRNEATDGRSFYAPRPEALVELDLAGIMPLRSEVLALARRLADEKVVKTVLKELVDIEFQERIGDLENALRIDVGALRLKMARKPLAKSDAIEALVADYSNANVGVIDIPANRITALSVLPFPMVSDDYRPVLDMCVRTSIDPEPQEVPGFPPPPEPLGTWFRFDVGLTDMVQLLPLGKSA